VTWKEAGGAVFRNSCFGGGDGHRATRRLNGGLTVLLALLRVRLALGMSVERAENDVARLECLRKVGATGAEYLQRVMTEGGEMRGGDIVRGDGTHFDFAEFGKLDADLEFAAVGGDAKLAGIHQTRQTWTGIRLNHGLRVRRGLCGTRRL